MPNCGTALNSVFLVGGTRREGSQETLEERILRYRGSIGGSIGLGIDPVHSGGPAHAWWLRPGNFISNTVCNLSRPMAWTRVAGINEDSGEG